MKKRFKSKKKRYVLKVLVILLFSFVGFLLSYKIFYNKVIEVINPKNYLNYLLKTGFNNQIDSSYIKSRITIPITNIIETENNLSNPIVYIYNTHDEEKYGNTFLNIYNISPNVKLASYYLQEKLNNLGINTIVEDRSIASVLKANNWIYKYSYQASRTYLEDTKNKYPSLKYFIDLHRDSSIKEKTTVEINNKSYAKILFIVGLEHDNYNKNLEVTTKLYNLINEKYPEILRSIYKKSGPGVNGIYNQDFNQNCILIEMGGQYNTIEEVANTIDLLAPILKDFFSEEEII